MKRFRMMRILDDILSRKGDDPSIVVMDRRKIRVRSGGTHCVPLTEKESAALGGLGAPVEVIIKKVLG